MPEFPFRQCGALLVGDYNSPSYSTNYHHLIDLFAARDLYKEYIVKHQKDEKSSYDPSSNSLIEKDSFPERIDYIFGLDRFIVEEPEFSSSLASR
jgi:endonuclease/exonuclease/phosphatase family metal-dependent hydrolase